MRVVFHRHFFDDAAKLPSAVADFVKKVVLTMENTSFVELSGAFDLLPLKGVKNGYRIRKGDYRILFTCENNAIFLRKIVSRGQAYKKHNVAIIRL